jgi:hypothetical protein
MNNVARDGGALKLAAPALCPRFTVGADGNVVTDNLTGLMWARNANLLRTLLSWDAAVAKCQNLDYGGYTDWRRA